ncbi:hypothetical protein GMMP1_80034 [Candidatus Magnetomoraceae bacterium gMMP-1]
MYDIKLIPYFQPIISLTSGAVAGIELLARGISPEGNLIFPGNIFKPDQHEYNRQIDMKIRKIAMKKAAHFQKQYPIFINVLPKNFLHIKNIRQDSHIWKLCEKFDFDPRNIVIEVVESATDKFENVVSILKEYTKLGFRIAIDDWGAGHSNFDRLNMLNPWLVKIDAAFLWKAATDPDVAETFKMAIEMIARMGIKVIVEGVETIEHLYMAMDGGCSMIQGFFMAKPSPVLPDINLCTKKIDKVMKSYSKDKICHLKNKKIRLHSYIKSIQDEFIPLGGYKIKLNDLFCNLKELINRDPDIIKVYVLDKLSGIQISSNLIRINDTILEDISKKGYDWSWRPYYIKFKVNYELFSKTYSITGPYLDAEVGQHFYTLVMVVDQYIVCIDFNSEI